MHPDTQDMLQLINLHCDKQWQCQGNGNNYRPTMKFSCAYLRNLIVYLSSSHS